MAQYIDKDAVMLEISELQGKLLIDYYRRGGQFAIGDDYKMKAYNEVLSLLNKFKVKKVDLDKEIKKYINDNICGYCVPGTEETAKYFFELGYGLSHS